MPALQNVQRDFVLGVLSEEELGQQIHIHELFREYVACVQTLRAYDAVSRDILQVRPLMLLSALAQCCLFPAVLALLRL